MNPFVLTLAIAAGAALIGMSAESAGPSTFILSAAALMLAPTRGEARDDGDDATDAGARSAWQVLPIEGAYDLVYRDEAGHFSIRRIDAQELKIGPGKTILGGYCEARDGYRGFRADRIERIADADTGEAAERNVIDWLLKRAARQARRRRAEAAFGVREARHSA